MRVITLREDGLTLFRFRNRTFTERIILHESHTPRAEPNAAGVLRAQGRVNGLLEIGYHYVIEGDGCVVECRHHTVLGSHAPGTNHDSIGICLAGCAGDEWDIHGDPQFRSLLNIYTELSLAYGRKLPVLGHDEAVRRKRSVSDHICPSFSMALVRQLLKAEKA